MAARDRAVHRVFLGIRRLVQRLHISRRQQLRQFLRDGVRSVLTDIVSNASLDALRIERRAAGLRAPNFESLLRSSSEIGSCCRKSGGTRLVLIYRVRL